MRALTRVATEETESFFLNVAQHGTAGHLERIVRYARQGLAFDDPDRVRSLVTKSFCDWHYDDDGMLVLRARLMADDGAKLVAALESMREHVVGESTLPSHDARDGNSLSALPVSARRAVALAAIAEAAAGMVIDPDRDCANGTSRSVPQIVVHIHSLPSNGPHGSAESSVCVDDSGREDSAESSVCTDEYRNDVPLNRPNVTTKIARETQLNRWGIFIANTQPNAKTIPLHRPLTSKTPLQFPWPRRGVSAAMPALSP